MTSPKTLTSPIRPLLVASPPPEEPPQQIEGGERGGKEDSSNKITRTFSWVTGWMLPGLGMFSNAYTMLAVGNIAPILKEEDPACWSKDGTACTEALRESIHFSVFVGIFIGMVLGGILGDIVGRRRGLIGTAMIMLLGSGLIVCCYGTTLQAQNTWYSLALGLFGVGVGGEYPLAAVASAEKAEEARLEAKRLGLSTKKEKRGQAVSLSFSMQGAGNWFNTVVILVLLVGFKQTSPPYITLRMELVWRLQYLVGTCVLIYLVVYRIKYVKESKAWLSQQEKRKKKQEQEHQQGTASSVSDSSRNVQQNNNNNNEKEKGGKPISIIATPSDCSPLLPSTLSSELNGKEKIKLFFTVFWPRLIGTAGGWFVWDFAFYGNKVFQTSFIKIFHPDASIMDILVYTLINNTIAYIGYFVAAATLDRPWMGRRRMQMMGFSMMFLLFLAGGVFWDSLRQPGSREIMQILYYTTTFFGQFGPNATTWIFPAEVYPTEVRAVGHGLSGAGGKTGALVATILFGKASDRARFLICAGCGFVGLLLTFFWLPEVMSMPLSENDAFWERIKADSKGITLPQPDGEDDRPDEDMNMKSTFHENRSIAERCLKLKRFQAS